MLWIGWKHRLDPFQSLIAVQLFSGSAVTVSCAAHGAGGSVGQGPSLVLTLQHGMSVGQFFGSIIPPLSSKGEDSAPSVPGSGHREGS